MYSPPPKQFEGRSRSTTLVIGDVLEALDSITKSSDVSVVREAMLHILDALACDGKYSLRAYSSHVPHFCVKTLKDFFLKKLKKDKHLMFSLPLSNFLIPR